MPVRSSTKDRNMPNMPSPIEQTSSRRCLVLLSRLLFPVRGGAPHEPPPVPGLVPVVGRMAREEFDQLLTAANANHVVVRGLEIFLGLMQESRDAIRAGWAEGALTAEHARIENALAFLHEICTCLEGNGCEVAVIKSLDHWPDLGSDLDLYTNASPNQVLQIMKERFQAQILSRSWGDRLAGKWNFMLPGLAEQVEIHIGHLGQTGEQAAIPSWLLERARTVTIGGRAFRVPSVPDRLMVSTLQRIYRHFYFRLCDIADTAALSEAGVINYQDLSRLAEIAGIWEGVATYLAIVSDFLRRYRGAGLPLPEFVSASARFGAEKTYFHGNFLRVPIMPESARLYGSQLAGLLRRRELHNSARLGLLPWLATAAAVTQKITGSDKGVW